MSKNRNVLTRHRSTQFFHNLARTIGQWRYPESKRDLRLDLLRGFAAVTMIIDHVGGDDSWLYTVSGGDRFLISAAEGFVFISGLVMGIVYASVAARKGVGSAMKKALRRALTLYSLSAGLSLAFAVVSFELELPWSPHVTSSNLLDYIFSILTMHRSFYLTDVMLLYTFVVAVTAPLLLLLQRGYGWLVLVGSWGLWGAWQWHSSYVQLPWVIIDNNVFHFAPWQALFITGLVIGYYRKWIAERFGRLVHPVTLVVSGALVGGTIGLYYWVQAHGNSQIDSLFLQLFSKGDLGVGRLAAFGCFFVFAFLLCTFAWTPVKRVIGWLLLPLGQQALNVYMMHLFVVALLAEGIALTIGSAYRPAGANAAIQAAGIMLIWVVVMVKEPAFARVGQAAGWARAWLSPSNLASSRQVAPNSESRPAVRSSASQVLANIAGSRIMRIGAALVVAGVVVLSTESVLAKALKRVPADETAYLSAVMASPTATPAGSRSRVLAFGTPLPEMTVPPALAPEKQATAAAAIGVSPSRTISATFMSQSLGRVMPYYVYLPPGYDSNPGKRYPVLYMLHGVSGTNEEWVRYGLFGRATDMMITKQIAPFMIVLPQGDLSYWMDQANGGDRWGSYVALDVVQEIDSHYRTLSDRDHRAVGGLSMGGHGALQLAINYPGVFGIAGADSPSLHDYNSAPSFFGDEAYFEKFDPVHLYQAHADIAKTLKIWIDDGQQDAWLPAISGFHQMLDAEGIPNEWHVFPGDHTSEYWSTHIPDYLNFYNSAFADPATPTPTTSHPGAAGSKLTGPVQEP